LRQRKADAGATVFNGRACTEILSMIATLCKRPIISIDASATLSQAAMLMREQHVGALVVTIARAERPEAIGIVTDRDLVLELLLYGTPGMH